MVVAPGKEGIGAFVVLADDEHLPVNFNDVRVLVFRRGKSTDGELKIVKEFGKLADPELLKSAEPAVCNYKGEDLPPIHQHADQSWWFYEATNTLEQGPFATYEEAYAAMEVYCQEYQNNLEKELDKEAKV